MAEWSEFYHDPANHRWSAIDQLVLEVAASAMGWGPDRTLMEIGGGRGEHSYRLWQMGRCTTPYVSDSSPESRLVASRRGVNVGSEPIHTDIVWSYGVCEHSDGPAGQALIDQHFAHAAQLVVIIVPAKSRTRAKPRATVPWQRPFTEPELRASVERKDWLVDVWSFAPLFGLRHIPDAFHTSLEKLLKRVLPGNLLIAVARRG